MLFSRIWPFATSFISRSMLPSTWCIVRVAVSFLESLMKRLRPVWTIIFPFARFAHGARNALPRCPPTSETENSSTESDSERRLETRRTMFYCVTGHSFCPGQREAWPTFIGTQHGMRETWPEGASLIANRVEHTLLRTQVLWE